VAVQLSCSGAVRDTRAPCSVGSEGRSGDFGEVQFVDATAPKAGVEELPSG